MANLFLESLREKESKILSQLELIRSMIEEELRKPIDSSSDSQTQIKNQKKSYGSSFSERFLNILKL